MGKRKSRNIPWTEKLLITARYDIDKAFNEEIEYLLENIQDNPEICQEHKELNKLSKLFLPDHPAEFNKQVEKQKLREDLSVCAERLVSQWDYMEGEYSRCLQDISIWLKEVDEPYVAITLSNGQGSRSSCQIISGEVDAGTLFEQIIPSADDLTFLMRGYTNYARIVINYQDINGGETIHVWPIREYIRDKVSYDRMLKIIGNNKQELTYWNIYPAQFDEESMLECIVMAIQEEMILWKWPKEWFRHRKQ